MLFVFMDLIIYSIYNLPGFNCTFIEQGNFILMFTLLTFTDIFTKWSYFISVLKTIQFLYTILLNLKLNNKI